MASAKTLALRGERPTSRVYVCAWCIGHRKGSERYGGTLQRSQEDGLLYHPEHLPERQATDDG